MALALPCWKSVLTPAAKPVPAMVIGSATPVKPRPGGAGGGAEQKRKAAPGPDLGGEARGERQEKQRALAGEPAACIGDGLRGEATVEQHREPQHYRTCAQRCGEIEPDARAEHVA